MGKIEVLKEIISKQRGETQIEKFYNGIQCGEISFTRLRNAAVIKDFDQLKSTLPLMRCYNELSERHCMSVELVRKVIRERDLNEI